MSWEDVLKTGQNTDRNSNRSRTTQDALEVEKRGCLS